MIIFLHRKDVGFQSWRKGKDYRSGQKFKYRLSYQGHEKN